MLFPAPADCLPQFFGPAVAIAVFVVIAYSMFFIAAFALPEIRGKVLYPDA